MDERYWDSQLETLPVERRRLLQDHRLRWQVRRCWEGSPFYRTRLEAAGIDPVTFGGLADLARIPILRAEDLPAGSHVEDARTRWAVAPEDWWQETEMLRSGVQRVLTDGDLVHRADLSARAWWAAGARPGETLTYWHDPDQVMQMGLRRIGAQALVGNGSRHAMLPLQPCVNSIVMHTCAADDGLHWADDHFLVELVDPETGAPARPGRAGVVVLTDLTREGSPLIRFWTGQGTVLTAEPCRCGRTSVRSLNVGTAKSLADRI